MNNYNYLTHREQEVPHLYRWWDELRETRCFFDFYIYLFINQS